MYRAAIFDLDGTLLDSLPLWEQLGARYLASIGRTPPPGLAEAVREMTLDQSARYLHGALRLPQQPEEIQRGLVQLLETAYRETLPLKPGAADLVGRLHRRGVPLALATLSHRTLAEAALDRLGLLRCFSVLLTAGEEQADKGTPRLYLEAARRLSVRPEETLVFEDSLAAARAAHEAGFPVAAVYDRQNAADWPALWQLAQWPLPDFLNGEIADLLAAFAALG